jgi:hypothetical protein
LVLAQFDEFTYSDWNHRIHLGTSGLASAELRNCNFFPHQPSVITKITQSLFVLEGATNWYIILLREEEKKMRIFTRLLATPASLGSKASLTAEPLALLPPIPLYRRLLRVHRKKLPAEMRLLGDEYVKSEFRAHRNVDNPIQIVSQGPRAIWAILCGQHSLTRSF